MECLSKQDSDSFVKGECPPDVHEQIATHLSGCARCADSVRSASFALNSTETGFDPVLRGKSTGAGGEGDSVDGSGGSQPNLSAGDLVLGYRLIDALGRGGMGVVWRGKREHEVDPVAIKTLPAGLRAAATELKRVRRVFDLIKTLRHPHIAAVYQLGEDPTWGPALIMELVEGITLRDYHTTNGDEEGRLPLDEVMRILDPVADALDYAHEVGVLHRDVKPSNIMLRPDGADVRLIDFGLGDEIRQSLVSLSVPGGPVAGTAPYMSPEQWRGHIPSPESDEYALGCVAYELLAGHPPFVASDSSILRKCHLDEPVPPIPDLSEPLSALLGALSSTRHARTALAKARSDRFRSCKEFIAALGRAGRKPVTPKHRTPTSAQQARKSRLKGEFDAAVCSQRPGVSDDRSFQEVQAHAARVLGIPRLLEVGAGISMSLIPRGDFVLGIGDPPSVDAQGLERPRRESIGEPFYLARWPITRATWKMVMGSWRSPTKVLFPRLSLRNLLKSGRAGKVGPSIYLPVDDVSLSDVDNFLDRINTSPCAVAIAKAGHNLEFRLPSEAEWEFACRAGTTTAYSFGDDPSHLEEHAWYRPNASGQSQKTATLATNGAFLFDMHGNVWEWCANNVLRGGSACSWAEEVTSTACMEAPAGVKKELVGLRIAATIVRRL